MRFTLPKLFLAVTFAAVACAGLLYPAHWFASVIVTLTWAMFAYAALRAIAFSGRDRVLAIAFALIGRTYLFVATCQLIGSVGGGLVTNYPIAVLARVRVNEIAAGTRLFRNVGIATVDGSPDGAAQEAEADSRSAAVQKGEVAVPVQTEAESEFPLDTLIMLATSNAVDDSEEFWPVKRIFLVGHCVWSWLIALGAACLAGRMYERHHEAGGAAGNMPSV